MRSGFFTERFSQLTALTDSNVVRGWLVALVIALVIAPAFLNAYMLSHLTMICLTLVGVLGLTVLTGFTGQISLGHVAFLVLGAYSYAIGTTRLGASPLVALLLSAVVPAASGLLVGIPSLRLKGLYLAITTLAFSFIVNAVILAGGKFTGAGRGITISRPEIFGISLASDQALYWFCLLCAVLALFATLNLRRTRAGRAMIAIRDNDIAAQAMGINLMRYKLTAFMVCAAMTGVSGALMAMYISFVTVEGFPFLLSIEALAILVVGGLGSVLGTVLGTVFILSLPEVTSLLFSLLGSHQAELMTSSAHEIKSMLYGIAVIAFLRIDPRGLRGIWHDLKHMWTYWPLRY